MNNHTQAPRNIVLDSAIQWYLQDLAEIPLMPLKAEREAVQHIAIDPHSQEADDARQRLVEANLRLVVRLARRYQPFGPEFADLVQEGNLALIKAAQQFDPQKGQRFKPFAARRICWTFYRVIQDSLCERHLLEPDMQPVYPLRSQVLKALAHNAIDEQALVFDLPEERFISFHALLKESDTAPPDEQSSAHLCCDEDEDPEERYFSQERRMCLMACLQTLTVRERLVLIHRYLLTTPQTLEEIGRMLGVSRERVRQLEIRGMRKMRHPRTARMLRSLL